jgi:hypothetical protein
MGILEDLDFEELIGLGKMLDTPSELLGGALLRSSWHRHCYEFEDGTGPAFRWSPTAFSWSTSGGVAAATSY